MPSTHPGPSAPPALTANVANATNVSGLIAHSAAKRAASPAGAGRGAAARPSLGVASAEIGPDEPVAVAVATATDMAIGAGAGSVGSDGSTSPGALRWERA